MKILKSAQSDTAMRQTGNGSVGAIRESGLFSALHRIYTRKLLSFTWLHNHAARWLSGVNGAVYRVLC